MFGPTDFTTIMARKGHGKTQLGRLITSAYPRVVIFDRMREHGIEPGRPDHAMITTLGGLERGLAWSQGEPSFRFVYQFDFRTTNKDAEFNRALELCYQRGSMLIVIEEVWAFAKPTWLPHAFEEICFTGRHRGLSLVTTSQRPGRVNKTILSQSSHIFCGQMTEVNDLNYLAEILGSDVEKLPTLEKFHFLWKSDYAPSRVVKNE